MAARFHRARVISGPRKACNCFGPLLEGSGAACHRRPRRPPAGSGRRRSIGWNSRPAVRPASVDGMEARAGARQFACSNDLARGGTVAQSIAFRNVPGPSVPPTKKTPPMDDGALKCFAGLWRQPRPTHADIFLQHSKYPRNAFHVSPTVRSFTEPKSELSPRELYARAVSERPTASRRAEGQRRHRTPIASCALRRPAPVRAVNGWGRAVGPRYQAPALYGDETALALCR